MRLTRIVHKNDSILGAKLAMLRDAFGDFNSSREIQWSEDKDKYTVSVDSMRACGVLSIRRDIPGPDGSTDYVMITLNTSGQETARYYSDDIVQLMCDWWTFMDETCTAQRREYEPHEQIELINAFFNSRE